MSCGQVRREWCFGQMNGIHRTDDGDMSVAPVSVYVADDSFLFREGLAQVLAQSPDIRVAGLFPGPDALLAAVDAAPPQVVVTDMRMAPTQTNEGMKVAERLRKSHPGVGVIILSTHGNPQYAAELLVSGASGRGYLLKDRVHDLDYLVSAIRAVAAGECRVDTQLIESLVSTRRQHSPLEQLTPRQREILADIAGGLSNQGIAVSRGLTLGAVEKHVSEIFGRLGLSSDEGISRRVHAVLLYLSDRNR